MKFLKRNTLARSGAIYSFSSTMSSVIGMVIGFLNMRWLGPELLGIWQSVTIVNSYLPIMQLGIQSGLNLELPILLGAQKNEEVRNVVSTAYFFALFQAVLFSLASVIVLFFLYIKGISSEIFWSSFAVAIMAIVSCFRLHYIATYRSARAFDKLSKIYLAECLLNICLVFGIYFYKFYGLLFYQVVSYLFVTILMWFFAPYRHINASFNKHQFLVLLKRGIFMTIVNQIKGIIESIPRLLILGFGGVVMVGIFNPALTIGSFMNLVPSQIAQFLHPQLGYKYGQTKKARDMWIYFKKLTIFMPICLFPISLIGWLVMPYILEIIFPKYIESLWPIRIMLVGFLFATTFFSRGFLITIKAYKEVIGLFIIDLILFLILPLLLVYLYPSEVLISISGGLSLAYIITYFINIFVVRQTIFRTKYN